MVKTSSISKPVHNLSPKKLDSSRIFEKVVEVANFYGFRPYIEIMERPKSVSDEQAIFAPVEKVRQVDTSRKQGSIIETYLKNETINHEDPKLVYFYTEPRERNKEKLEEEHGRFNLEIFGLQRSIGEATILRTCLSILEEMGHIEPTISINSMGDKESMLRFSREYLAYYKRPSLDMHATCRENLKKNPSKMFSCRNERCVALREEAPQTISCLSETSRIHFKEVLEFLEAMHASYEIDSTLVRDTDRFCETIFEIHRSARNKEDGEETLPAQILAHGGRYNYFARKIGSKKDIPIVGASIALSAPAHTAKSLIHKRKPKIYFIQLGHEATRKSFPVLEILRKVRMPLLQSHGTNQLIGQLSIAEKLAIPYTMIMGQREAVDGTVIIRNTSTRKQDTVPLAMLATYLQNLA
ncbi:MAG: histidyl-tRNA synthetase [Parcubacteria group bacterium Gr01-1014_48]